MAFNFFNIFWGRKQRMNAKIICNVKSNLWEDSMYRLKVLNAEAVRSEGLMEMITELEEYNEQASQEQKRSDSGTAEDIYIVVLTETNQVAGYLQCGSGSGSMKVDRRHGQSILISQLLLRAKKDLMLYGHSCSH